MYPTNIINLTNVFIIYRLLINIFNNKYIIFHVENKKNKLLIIGGFKIIFTFVHQSSATWFILFFFFKKKKEQQS